MTEAPPPSGTLDDALPIPDTNASFLSQLTFQWITPLLNLGYGRPLEITDLWKMDAWRHPDVYADKILTSFERRHAAAQTYNARLASGEVSPSLRQKIWWTLKRDRKAREKRWREIDGKRKASLILAMNDAVKWFFWPGGVFRFVFLYKCDLWIQGAFPFSPYPPARFTQNHRRYLSNHQSSRNQSIHLFSSSPSDSPHLTRLPPI
jgi:hypothetical protein